MSNVVTAVLLRTYFVLAYRFNRSNVIAKQLTSKSADSKMLVWLQGILKLRMHSVHVPDCVFLFWQILCNFGSFQIEIVNSDQVVICVHM